MNARRTDHLEPLNVSPGTKELTPQLLPAVLSHAYLDKDQYLRDMNQGLGTWGQVRAAGVDEQTISRQRQVRNDYYQEYLRTEAIEIEGVLETLAELSKYVRMAIMTTVKRAGPPT